MDLIIYYFLTATPYLLITLVGLIVIKLILYITWEKRWDAINFFYFSKVALKHTTNPKVRVIRKRQNTISTTMLLLFLLLIISFLFHLLVME